MINAIRKYFRKRAERAALNVELQASLDRLQDAEYKPIMCRVQGLPSFAHVRIGDYVEAFDGTIGRVALERSPFHEIGFVVQWSCFGRSEYPVCFYTEHDEGGRLLPPGLCYPGELRIKRILPAGAVRLIPPKPALRHVATLKCRRTGQRLKVYGGGRGDLPSPIFDTLELGI